MGAVYHYDPKEEIVERFWKVSDDIRFIALIKCYVIDQGKQKVIEKPSTRPASFIECYRYAQKLKREYGRNLKQVVIWNLDEMKEKYSDFSD